jgi:aspartokinase
MEQDNFPIAKQVKNYINRKPYILEAIEQNIVNYSALSREIGGDLGIKNVDTIKAALIRSAETYRKKRRKTQKRAIELLRESNVSVKNKIATLHHSTFIDIKAIAYSKTPSGYMFFLDENVARKSSFKKIDYGFAILQIKSPKEIEKTPGAIAFILSALAFEGINISHVMGCREDTFIVVQEHDASLAFRILAQRLRI